jgi:hypothetical protein
LRDQRLAKIENLEIDQPAHDDMGKDHELGDIEDQKQYLQQRGHEAVLRAGSG